MGTLQVQFLRKQLFCTNLILENENFVDWNFQKSPFSGSQKTGNPAPEKAIFWGNW